MEHKQWIAKITVHANRVTVDVTRPDGYSFRPYSCGCSELYTRDKLVNLYRKQYSHFDFVEVLYAQ